LSFGYQDIEIEDIVPPALSNGNTLGAKPYR